MSDIAVKVEHLSKMYRLGVINNGTLFRDIQTWLALKRGKEDPHSKIGENKYRGDEDHFWALKDISFDIKKGDRVGIIGKNGAGKSTLLKLLSRITAPTEGNIKIKGKVASLLEVGTGFHGELTGRENIYLNGAILGMKVRRIDEKIDEIIAFSGIEHHIDTPVKRYSSGMYVRLAFAVAAYLDSDILIADEVLAVGDAEFQKKALGKMEDLSTGEGRTVLFVSHNMGAVKQLCNNGIIFQNGKILSHYKNIDETVALYLLGNNNNKNKKRNKESILRDINSLPKDDSAKLLDIKLIQNNIEIYEQVSNGIPLEIEITYEIFKMEKGLRVYFDLCDQLGDLIFRSFHDEKNIENFIMKPGIYVSKVNIPENLLGNTSYNIFIHITVFNVRNCTGEGIKIPVTVNNTGIYNQAYSNVDTFRGKLGIALQWATFQ